MISESKIKSFSILFWGQKNRKNNRKEIPIYMRITVDGKRAEFSTNQFVEEKAWDSKAQRVKNRAANAIQKNSYLDMMRGKAQEAFNKLLSADEEITAQKIKSIITGKATKQTSKHKTLMDAFQYHNTKLQQEYEIGKVVKKTVIRYTTTKNKVVNFMKYQYKMNDIPLPEMRLRFVTEFEHYFPSVFSPGWPFWIYRFSAFLTFCSNSKK